jgi:rSAM/selenodomain-associated transferase 2
MMRRPTFSVIIPVLHEGVLINTMISQVRKDDPSAEVLVVDGDSNKSTISQIKDKKVKGYYCKERGRARQCNHAAQKAKGDIIVFLHVDTTIPKGFFKALVKARKTSGLRAGAFDFMIDSPRNIFRVMEKLATWRSRLTRVPYGDQAQWFEKEYFMSIGMFKPMPFMEDLEIMNRIKRRKDRIVISPTKVKTSARRWESEGVIYGILRNWTIEILWHLGWSAKTLGRYYKRGNAVYGKICFRRNK